MVETQRTVKYSYNVGGGGGPGGIDELSGPGYKSSIRTREFKAGGGGDVALVDASQNSSFLSTPTSVIASREKEKRDLQDLNERFAAYIETVRFLEFHNKKLSADIDFYRNKIDRLANLIKQIYEAELKQAKELVDDNRQDRERLETKLRKLEDDLREQKEKYDKLLRIREDEREALLELEDKLAVKLAEIESLQRKCNIFDNDIFLYKKEYNKLLGQLKNIQMSVDDEKMLRGDLENRISAIQDEIDYRQRQHEQELADILDELFKDDTSMYRDIFHNELTNALKEIRKEFDSTQPDRDREAYYQSKIQEVIKMTAQKSQEELTSREEAKRIRQKELDLQREVTNLQARNDYLIRRIEELEKNLEYERSNFQDALDSRDSQIEELRKKLEEIMRELQELTDLKLRLDAEIAQYRALLAGEEQRLSDSMANWNASQSIQYNISDKERVVRSEANMRTSFQKSSRGVISFNEMSPDGNFVVLENISRDKDQKLDSWQMKRSVNGGSDDVIHSFGPGNTLRAGKTMRVSTRPFKRSGDSSMRITTVLVNDKGDEAASIIMKSSAS